MHSAIRPAEEVGGGLEPAFAEVDAPCGGQVADVAIEFGFFDRHLLVLPRGLARDLDVAQAENVAAQRGRFDAQVAAIEAAGEFHVGGAGPLDVEVRAERAVELQPWHATGRQALEQGQRERGGLQAEIAIGGRHAAGSWVGRRRIARLEMPFEGQTARMSAVVDRGGAFHHRRKGQLPREIQGELQIRDVPALLRFLIDDRRLAIDDLQREIDASARRTARCRTARRRQPGGEYRLDVAAVAGQPGMEPRLLDPQRADVRGVEKEFQERTVAGQVVGLQDRISLGVMDFDAGNRSRRKPADRCGTKGYGTVQPGCAADEIAHQRRVGDDRRQQADHKRQP